MFNRARQGAKLARNEVWNALLLWLKGQALSWTGEAGEAPDSRG
jgi:hypothetical protein